MIEALQGEVFREAFVRYNAIPDDDPAGGDSPGDSFAVAGLEPLPADPDGLPGEVIFPGDGVQLLEHVVDVELGMPRDLGGATGVDADDHASDYRALPVMVRVRWRGISGEQEIVLATTLSNDKNVP